ncbi:DNRLRE domain-containing protein [Brevibacillus brevis]|uniref:DNRLRE domain-containing protein n=1 Tax=Brevibacillus brevis TaxID=1393 RepID=A0A517IFH8_BREBE|nr:DNRLRE domain-containing protein [Brevibacillus brevis]QDS37645.1 DNRLRE domain-containing protein [Brevibacillus brevis]
MPVINLTYSNSITGDSYVTSNSPNNSFVGQAASAFGKSTNGSAQYFSYINFDLGTLPTNAIINSAKLTLTRFSGTGSGTYPFVATMVTSPWKNEELTFNNQPTLGTSKVQDVFSTGTSPVVMDIAPLVREWISCKSVNFGIRLSLVNDNDYLDFTYHNSRASDLNFAPRLIVDYTAPENREDVYIVNKVSQNGSGTSFSPTLPTGYTDKDYIITSVIIENKSEAINIAGDWEVIHDVVQNYRHILLRKIVSGNGVVTPPTFSTTNYVPYRVGSMIYRNVDVMTPVQIRNDGLFARVTTVPDAQSMRSGAMFVGIMSLEANTPPLTTNPKGYEIYSLPWTSTRTQWATRNLMARTALTPEERTFNYVDNARYVNFAFVLEAKYNQPPTPPTNVTMDKTSYNVGEKMQISFTMGTDPEGGTVMARVEQYNPGKGAWEFIGNTPTSPTILNCSAMLDTTESKIRVYTEDDKGMLSTPTETTAFSVKQRNGAITVPTEIASGSYYNISSAPIMRFDNGWFGHVVRDAAGTIGYLRMSKDGGKNWGNYGYFNGLLTKGWSTVSNGNMLYIVCQQATTMVSMLSIDVTQLSLNGTIPGSWYSAHSVVDTNSFSLAFNKVKNALSIVFTAKQSGLPNAFNIVRGEADLKDDGTIKGFLGFKSLSNSNATNVTFSNVNHDISHDGTRESIVYREMNGTLAYMGSIYSLLSSNSWSSKIIYNASSGTIINPTVRFSPGGVVNFFAGVSVVGIVKALYCRSLDNMSTVQSYVDLGNCTDVAMAVDKENAVYVYISNGNTLYMTSSTDGFATFPASKVLTSEVIIPIQNSISPFRETSLKTVTTVPPIAFRQQRPSDSAQMVSFLGTWQVAEPPVVTLSSPANGMQLIEGQNYIVTGETLCKSAGAVVNVKIAVSAITTTIDSYVSDGTTPRSFSKTLTYKNKQLFDGATPVSSVLSESVQYTMIVSATDTTNTVNSLPVYRDFTVKYNMPPVISGTNQDLGAVMQIPSANYSATDPEANTFTFTEYLNGKQIRSFAGVAGQQYTVEISHDAWIRLDLDAQHQIKIVATDSAGISSERIYTFTRTETHIEFMLEYGNPDIKADFTLDGMPLRVLMTLERYLPEGSSIESVKVCNNYLDDVPTWEDCTNAVKVNRGYLFTNKNKTAPKWAINLWVTINKGTAKERVLVNGYGGAFD